MDRTLVHLDTDLGGDIDDLCALAYLLASPAVELIGVTTVLEDGGRRAGYVRRALELAGRSDVPVAAGAELRLGYCRLEAGLPPEERYWLDPVSPAPGPLDDALDLLALSIVRGAVVVGIGPLTNLAYFERAWPGALDRTRLVAMGGHVRPAPAGFPRWDGATDYNLQADPVAARLVLGTARATLVPIEVTAQTALRRSQLTALRAAGPLARLIARQAESFAEDDQIAGRYAADCPGLPEDIVNFQHDPLACAVALGWSGVEVETLPLALDLADGQLRMRVERGGRPIVVITAVNRDAFADHWLATVTGRAG